ncbi:MAG: hypothetical protein HS111_09635 [Kofleriaceae bacterium]|nr:hypothetical protein [Kofleriaceae bacterium]
MRHSRPARATRPARVARPAAPAPPGRPPAPRSVRCAALLAAALAAAACRTPAPAAPPAPWQVVEVAGAPRPLYLYPEPIERYAPDDRGAYVVRVPDGPERDAVVAAVGAGDDLVGVDGFVIRLVAAGRDALAARAGVAEVAILQPAARRSRLVDGAAEVAEVRVDLFADAHADEVAAVAAWLEARGGRVLWRGRAALRARVPRAAIAEASRLSPVRWIE